MNSEIATVANSKEQTIPFQLMWVCLPRGDTFAGPAQPIKLKGHKLPNGFNVSRRFSRAVSIASIDCLSIVLAPAVH